MLLPAKRVKRMKRVKRAEAEKGRDESAESEDSEEREEYATLYTPTARETSHLNCARQFTLKPYTTLYT